MGEGQSSEARRAAAASGSAVGTVQRVADMLFVAADDTDVASADARVYSVKNLLSVRFYRRPIAFGQFDNGDLAIAEILLVCQILVTGYEDVEAWGPGSSYQGTIYGLIPTHRERGSHDMPLQISPELSGRVLVEQDVHPADFNAVRRLAYDKTPKISVGCRS
jgi:hypothetical protein